MSDQHNHPANNGGVINNRPTLNSSPIGNNSNDRPSVQPHQQQQMHPSHMDYYEGMPPHGPGAPSPSNNSEGYMKGSHGGSSSSYSGPGMRSPSQSQGGWGGPYGHSPHHGHGHYAPPPHHMQHGPPPGYGMPPPNPHGPSYPPSYPPWQHPSYMHQPHYPPPYMHQHGPPSAPTPPHQARRGKDKEGAKSNSPEPNKPLHPKPPTSPSSSDGDSPSKSPLNHHEVQTITVPPMRPDFYFFVQDHKDPILDECKAELPIIYRRLRIPPPTETDSTLLFSHINERLIALWESTPSSSRQTYMVQEEEDRKRFMNAEEVASQHCATLTARVKSPAFSLDKPKKDEVHEKKSRQLEETPDMFNPISPTKKNRIDDTPSMTPHRDIVKPDRSSPGSMPVQQETV